MLSCSTTKGNQPLSGPDCHPIFPVSFTPAPGGKQKNWLEICIDNSILRHEARELNFVFLASVRLFGESPFDMEQFPVILIYLSSH